MSNPPRKDGTTMAMLLTARELSAVSIAVIDKYGPCARVIDYTDRWEDYVFVHVDTGHGPYRYADDTVTFVGDTAVMVDSPDQRYDAMTDRERIAIHTAYDDADAADSYASALASAWEAYADDADQDPAWKSCDAAGSSR